MSFSLKREIEFYINDVDSTDGVQKLAILPEFELELSAELLQVYRKIIGEDPEMLPRGAVDQISPISIGFMTYLKPSFLDGKFGVTAPEKILYDSIGGILGYRGSEYYKVQFGRVNRLLPLYIFLRTTTAVYKINLAYIDSLEVSFDINYFLTGKWTAKAISFEIFNYDDVVFTNVKDYTNIENYIRNKFTITTITDYSKVEKEYKFPITKASLKIVNTLMPVYDKNIKVVTGTVKDLIIGGRAITGELSTYLTSRIKHSKEFLVDVYNDLMSVNRKFKVRFLASDENRSVDIIIPRAILNIPNLDFEDVLNINVQFTSTESIYGINDDISYKYYYTNTNLTYIDYVKSRLNPVYYYKFNEIPNTTLVNHGTAGTNFNLTTETSYNKWPVTNQNGKYLNSKSWLIDYSICKNTAIKTPSDKLYISFWYKPTTTSANENIFYYQRSQFDTIVKVVRENSIAGGGYRGIVVQSGNSYYKFDIVSLNTWNLFTIYIDINTQKVIVYYNTTKVVDNTFSISSSYTSDVLSIGVEFQNPIKNSYFSELIISNEHFSTEELEEIASTLYNVADINEVIPYIPIVITDYNDTLITYYGISDLYMRTVKSFNPKAHWRFNDNDSNIVRDHINGLYPLNLYNRPELRLDGPILNDNTSKGIWFNKLEDNSLQYTTGTNDPILTTGITENTYIFWVYIDDYQLSSLNHKQCLLKTNSDSTYVTTLLHSIGSENNSHQYIYNNELYYKFDVGYGSGFNDCTYGYGVYFGIRLQRWTCIALACNKTNNTIKIYVDGTFINTVTNSNVGAYWPNSIALEVGKRTYNNTNRSTFKISEFSYFEYELTENTIQGIYAASGRNGFNVYVQPTKGNITITGKTPYILIGKSISLFSGSISISGNNIVSGTIKYVTPLVGYNLILEYWDPTILNYENVPIIKVLYNYSGVKGSISNIGNTPYILRSKIIYPIKGTIQLNNYASTFKFTYTTGKPTIYVISFIPSVGTIKSVNVTNGNIEINSYIPEINIIQSGWEEIRMVVLI